MGGPINPATPVNLIKISDYESPAQTVSSISNNPAPIAPPVIP